MDELSALPPRRSPAMDAPPAPPRSGEMARFARGPAPGGTYELKVGERKRFLVGLFAEESMTDSDREVFLRWLGWRIAREAAILQGLITFDCGLVDLGTPTLGSVWYVPCARMACTDTTGGPDKPLTEWSLTSLMLWGDGVPLVPTEGMEERFLEVVRRVSTARRLYIGTQAVPQAWNLATAGIETPADLLRLWPTPGDILEFEEKAIVHGYEVLVNGSRAAALQELHTLLGIPRYEAGGLLQAGVTMFSRVAHLDTDHKRFLMEQRLEGVAHRAREACDLDQELRALKQLGTIQGLTRTEPISQTDEIIGVIQAISDATSQKAKPRLRISASRDEDDYPDEESEVETA